MKVALIGSAGRVGRHIAREAQMRGHDLLCLTRPGGSPAQAPSRSQAVDVFDALALAEAVRGHDAIVSAYGAPADAPQRLPAATAAIVAAAGAAGVQRLLTVGGAGGLLVSPGMRLADTEGFPPGLMPKVKAHEDAVAALASSGLRWTCMAPAAQIVEGERSGHYRLAVGELVSQRISYADFACALLDELEAGGHLFQVVGTGH